MQIWSGARGDAEPGVSIQSRSESVAESQAEVSGGALSTERVAALRSLLSDCSATLSVDQQQEVWRLLVEFADVFSLDETDIGRTECKVCMDQCSGVRV